jgi:2-iminobutanoate/2-iminopropanoate deaminase
VSQPPECWRCHTPLIFLTNLADFAGMNEVYAKFFTTDFPARSTIQVAALPKGANVEIEVIAHF